ncbi:Fyve, RhoGef and Ph domain-containing protein [Halotydeus destructor]|nr:Fyve, RhoGef and Ph domain-containing protein [Halotydeus destructor]
MSKLEAQDTVDSEFTVIADDNSLNQDMKELYKLNDDNMGDSFEYADSSQAASPQPTLTKEQALTIQSTLSVQPALTRQLALTKPPALTKMETQDTVDSEFTVTVDDHSLNHDMKELYKLNQDNMRDSFEYADTSQALTREPSFQLYENDVLGKDALEVISMSDRTEDKEALSDVPEEEVNSEMTRRTSNLGSIRSVCSARETKVEKLRTMTKEFGTNCVHGLGTVRDKFSDLFKKRPHMPTSLRTGVDRTIEPEIDPDDQRLELDMVVRSDEETRRKAEKALEKMEDDLRKMKEKTLKKTEKEMKKLEDERRKMMLKADDEMKKIEATRLAQEAELVKKKEKQKKREEEQKRKDEEQKERGKELKEKDKELKKRETELKAKEKELKSLEIQIAKRGRSVEAKPSIFCWESAYEVATPSDGPSRPPRNRRTLRPATSAPTINQDTAPVMSSTPFKPFRRDPPPRPPPPAAKPVEPLSKPHFEDVPLRESPVLEDLYAKPRKIPPQEFYLGLRCDYRERYQQKVEWMLSSDRLDNQVNYQSSVENLKTRPPPIPRRHRRRQVRNWTPGHPVNGSNPRPYVGYEEPAPLFMATSWSSYEKMKGRPLPTLPKPSPPPKPRWLSSAPEPAVNPNRSLSHTPVSGVQVRDVAVSTKDYKYEARTREIQVQTSFDDSSENNPPSVTLCNEQNGLRADGFNQTVPRARLDLNANLPSPAPPVHSQGSLLKSPSPNADLTPKAQSRLSDDPSTKTVGSYHDAEDCGQDTDQDGGHDPDTFADVDSIGTTATISSTKFQSAETTPKVRSRTVSPGLSRLPSASSSFRRTGSLERSNQSRPKFNTSAPMTRSASATRPLAFQSHRRPSGGAARVYGTEFDDDSDNSDAVTDLAANLQQELKMILQRRMSRQKDNDDDDKIQFESMMKQSQERECDVSLQDTITTLESCNLSPRSSFTSNTSLLTVPGTELTGSSVTPFTTDGEDNEDDTISLDETVNDSPNDKRSKKQYHIAQELTQTEESFVDVLKLLNVDFRAIASNHLSKDVINQILPYLAELQKLNEQMLSMFQSRLSQYNEKKKIADVIVLVGPFLKQYSMYMKDFSVMTSTLEDVTKKFPSFAAALKEFESSSRCCKLCVKHYMLAPVQRIPRYRLLLREYLKNLDDDHPDYQDTQKALDIVSVVNEHANQTVREGDSFIKLLTIQNNLIVTKELIKPGRILLLEGDLYKLSRKEPQLRRFVLCSDCLLYLTVVQQGTFRLNYEIPLTGMKVLKPVVDDYQNELQIISCVRSFTLAASSTKERDTWYEALSSAILENANRRSTFETVVRGTSILETTIEDDLGGVAPVWVPDKRVTMCQLCTSEFTVTFRRHHCRCCGRVFCSDCSANRAPLKYLRYRAARVCNMCFDKLQEGMTKHGQSTRISNRVSTFYDDSLEVSSGELDVSRVSANDKDKNNDVVYDDIMRRFERNCSTPGVRSSGRKKNVPRVLTEIAAYDGNCLISGYLYERRKKKDWEKFWFLIKDKIMFKYKASEDIAAINSTPLLSWAVSSAENNVDHFSKDLIFELSHHSMQKMIFRVDCAGIRDKWVSAMKTATVLD